MKEKSPSVQWNSIYNCRNIRGGSQKSLHAEGRALDWGLNVNNNVEEEEAQRLINEFLADDASLARRMGIQEIIHNRRIWSSKYPESGLRPYNGENPHTDHIHIGLNWKGARKETSFWQSYSC